MFIVTCMKLQVGDFDHFSRSHQIYMEQKTAKCMFSFFLLCLAFTSKFMEAVMSLLKNVETVTF